MQIKTTVKRLSAFGFCIYEYDCFKIDAIGHIKRKFIDENDLYVSDRGRVYTPVKFYKSSERIFWMDCITGTLFTVTGFNKTTNFRLNVESLIHDQDLGGKILLSKKSSGYGWSNERVA